MQRSLFLDRDGVINVDKRYVWRIEDFEFLPGIFELCDAAQRLGYIPLVITNQAGIGRGYYCEADFQQLTAWMLERFRERGIRIGRVYHCPFHPTEGIGDYRRAFPQMSLYAAPGLPAKRKDLAFDAVLSSEAPTEWAGQLDQEHFAGLPLLGEVQLANLR